MDLERLGSALRVRREALGIPRAEVARRVEVSPTYIWMIEGARPRKSGDPSRPTRAVLERWARALGMDERYARQVLLLAGYEEGDATFSTQRMVPLRMLSPMEDRPTPSEMVMNRSDDFNVPRSLDSGPDGEPEMLFAAAPVNFPQPPDLEREVLLEQLREVLSAADESNRREETVQLLQSFLDWLQFRLEE